MTASARGLHRYWPVHLGVAIAIVVSLGFTFVTISFRSEPLPDQSGGRMRYVDRASFLGRGTGLAAVLGEGLRVVLGPGAILVPAAFALAGGWNVARLILEHTSPLRHRDDAPDGRTAELPAAEAHRPVAGDGRAAPPVVRAVGWYLLGLLVLQIAILIGAPIGIQPGSLAWRLPLGLWQIVAGAGLVTGRRWAYPATLALGALSAVWYVVFLVIGGLSVVGRAPVLFLPLLLMGALLLAPFALLLRSDGRAWFAARS